MNLSTFDTFKRVKPPEGAIRIDGNRLVGLQRVLLSMWDDILRTCHRHRLDIYLCGGSCLGAVRHQGFIPWDDDIDVSITRKDYEAFKRYFVEEHPGKYQLHDPREKHDYGLGFVRIRKIGTVVKNREDFLADIDECGACIDVCIVENTPNNAILRALHGFGSMAIGFLLSCRKFARLETEYLQMAADDKELTRVFKMKIKIGKLLSFASLDWWTAAWDRWNRLCRNDNSEYVAIPSGRKHYFGETFKRTDLFPCKEVPFEGAVGKIPAKPDVYLKALYGDDYMSVPPVEDREAHIVYEFDLGETAK